MKTARAKATRVFTEKELRKRCAQLQTLLSHPTTPIATPEEIAGVWPKGQANHYTGIDAWIWCWGQLTGFARRSEKRERADAHTDAITAAMSAASAGHAETITLANGQLLSVHPKGLHAGAWIEGLAHFHANAQLAIASDLIAAGVDDAQGAQLMLALSKSKAVMMYLWIITHPGAGVPWDEDPTLSDPPAHLQDLLGEDIIALNAADARVNGARTTLLAQAFPVESGERGRFGLAGMVSGYAHEHGISEAEVRSRLSIGKIVAGALAAHESHRVSQVNAERDRQRKGGR